MKTLLKFRSVAVTIALSFFLFACEDSSLTESRRDPSLDNSVDNLSSANSFGNNHRATYVLVHGAWHPESCWNDIKLLLQASGHAVKTVQLPGLGKDQTPVETVTFADHVNAVKNAVLQQSGPVILVGHSYAGAVVSQVGEDIPEKIKKLIYISGQMPGDGETIAQWALADTASVVTKNLIVDGAVAYMTKENYEKGLYNVALKGGPLMVWKAEKIISELRPHPLATLFVPLHLSSVYRSLDKVYISCLQDKAVTPVAQRNMYSRFPETKIYFIRKSDHSPFVSAPFELLELLVK